MSRDRAASAERKRAVARCASGDRWHAKEMTARRHSVGVAEFLQHGFVVDPAFAHLHPQTQEHLALEGTLHVTARAAADGLELCATVADHDRLLSVALDPDHGMDFSHAIR